MFSLFKKQKQANVTDERGLTQWLTDKATHLQQLWATFMGRWMEKLSARGKKILVIVFCIVSGCYCSWTIYLCFYKRHPTFYSVTSIQAPSHVTETGKTTITKHMIITERGHQRIRQFHAYIDSLRGSSAGTKTADSLLGLRPGLMDSIYQLEELYSQQHSKNK